MFKLGEGEGLEVVVGLDVGNGEGFGVGDVEGLGDVGKEWNGCIEREGDRAGDAVSGFSSIVGFGVGFDVGL